MKSICEEIKVGLQERKAEKIDNTEESDEAGDAPKRERKTRATAKKTVAKEDQEAMNAAVLSKVAKDEDAE